jgi:hypothetical protein
MESNAEVDDGRRPMESDVEVDGGLQKWALLRAVRRGCCEAGRTNLLNGATGVATKDGMWCYHGATAILAVATSIAAMSILHCYHGAAVFLPWRSGAATNGG